MMHTDLEAFEKRFPEASAFLKAAELRSEMYRLTQHAWRTKWEDARIEELKNAPACQEPWFVRALEELRALDDKRRKK